MRAKITQKTLHDLEFERVLEQIAVFSGTDTGKKAVLDIRPFEEVPDMITELDRTDEYLGSFSNDTRIPNHYFEDVTDALHLLQIKDSFLEGSALLKLAAVANTTTELIRFFRKNEGIYPVLAAHILQLEYEPIIAQRIEQILTPFGEVKDDASEALQYLRKEINRVRGQIGASFTRALNHYASAGYLDDIKESVMDNRRVLAVQAMHRKKVKGTILGSSKTGSIVFIAPQSTQEFSRELQNLQFEEEEETTRILKQLTDEIRPFSGVLNAYRDYLTQLDVIAAKAKYARHSKACKPKIRRDKKIDLKKAFHPILWEENQKKGALTIPQDIRLDKAQRIIVISGPNAGGKSITLKTIGLLQVMLQSGILIPVKENSEMSFFGNILTDIGDNQSIENHLSTYSYRLKNMRVFLKKCNANTLFLIDEFGTGSDPELGGALAETFLEEFYNKGAYGIITTHYANLKVLADEMEQMTNANMQFDQRSLEPLFKLVTGQAGSSFTFEVAQKNGIPYSLINRARKKVERGKIRLDKTIAKLQKERLLLQRTSEKLNKEKRVAEQYAADLSVKQENITKKLNSFQELYDKNQKMLSYGRKINEIIHRYFQTRNKKELFSQFFKWVSMEQARYEENRKEKEAELIKALPKKKEAVPLSKRERKIINRQKRLIEQQKKEVLEKAEKEVLKEVEKIREIKKETEQREQAIDITNYQFQVNDRVRLIDGNAKGTIEKIEKNIATINYGIFKAKTDIKQLELVEKAKK